MKTLILAISLAAISISTMAHPLMNMTKEEVKMYYFDLEANDRIEIDTIVVNEEANSIGITYEYIDDMNMYHKKVSGVLFDKAGKVYRVFDDSYAYISFWEEILIEKLKAEKPSPKGLRIMLPKTFKAVNEYYYYGDCTMQVVTDFYPEYLSLIYTRTDL